MAHLYSYEPFYGVEDWKNVAGIAPDALYGGGADLTAQNLLISLWQIDTSANQLPATGSLLRPAYTTPLAVEYNGDFGATGLFTAPGEKPSFKSRTSCKFFFGAGEDSPQPPNPSLLAILNPPQDIKTLYQNALRTALNPAKPFGVDLNALKPARLASQAFQTSVGGMGEIPNKTGLALYGDFMSPYLISPYQGFPLCYTSGANGVFPTFTSSLGRRALGLDPTSDFIATVDAVNRGDFYIPVFIQPPDLEKGQDTAVTIYTISWPHSVARG